jgi:hypothetical protein
MMDAITRPTPTPVVRSQSFQEQRNQDGQARSSRATYHLGSAWRARLAGGGFGGTAGICGSFIGRDSSAEPAFREAQILPCKKTGGGEDQKTIRGAYSLCQA